MRILISVAAVFLTMTTNAILVVSLRPYRIDLEPQQSMFEGKSKIWQWNVFNSSNYDAEGKRRLRWCYLAMALQMLTFASVAFLAV